MRIRSARPEDASMISACIAMAEGELMTFFTGEDDPGEQQRVMREFVLSQIPNRHGLDYCLVAEVGGEAAGMMLAFPADEQQKLDRVLLDYLRERGTKTDRLFPEGEKGSYYLSTIGVDPKFRGQGVGSALVKAGVEKGYELGFLRISLLVAEEKPKVRALYERLGFALLEPVDFSGLKYFRMFKQR